MPFIIDDILIGSLITGAATVGTQVYTSEQAKKLGKAQSKSNEKQAAAANKTALEIAKLDLKKAQIAANATAPVGSIVPVEQYANNVRNLIGGSHKADADRNIALNSDTTANHNVMLIAGVAVVGVVGLILLSR